MGIEVGDEVYVETARGQTAVTVAGIKEAHRLFLKFPLDKYKHVIRKAPHYEKTPRDNDNLC